jgi:hypothetical protein
MDINMSEKMSGETTMTELEIDVRGLYEVLKTYRRSFVREKLGEILGEQSEGGDHA